jgi:hypothetical protein
MQDCISTEKTILAAALGTLGFPVQYSRSLDDKSGKQDRRFYIAATSIDGKLRSNGLRMAFEDDSLLRDLSAGVLPLTEQAAAGVHLLDIVYAKANRDRILDAVNKGTRIRFVKQKGAERTFYETGPGTSFPGVAGRPQLMRTADLNLVAALARFGVPVLEVEGVSGSRRFLLDPLQRMTTPLGEFAGDWVRDWRAGKVSEDHPVAYAVLGLVNYRRLIEGMRKEIEQVFIQHPRTRRKAIVDPRITGAGMDKAYKFFTE